MGVLGAVAHSPEQLDIDLDWIEDEVKGKPYGVDLLVPEKFAGSDEGGLDRDAAGATCSPTSTRRSSTTCSSATTCRRCPRAWRLGRGVGGMRIDPKSMAPLLDVCFAHRPALVASALGPPPPHFIERAHAARHPGRRAGRLRRARPPPRRGGRRPDRRPGHRGRRPHRADRHHGARPRGGRRRRARCPCSPPAASPGAASSPPAWPSAPTACGAVRCGSPPRRPRPRRR